MTTKEALQFAKEMKEKLCYRLECSTKIPCRSYHERQFEMLVQACIALSEKIDRETNCGAKMDL